MCNILIHFSVSFQDKGKCSICALCRQFSWIADEARSEEYTGGMTDDKLDTGVLLTVIQPTCPDRLHIGMMGFYDKRTLGNM